LKFEHKVTVEAPVATVRAFLDDFRKASACVPGLESVEEVEPDVYDGRVKVKIGPLGIGIQGRATVQRDSEAWHVKGEGRDRRIGAGVNANVEARLVEVTPQQTEMQMLADVQFSGRLAELGQPLIKKKADAFVAEFTQNLQKAIAKEGTPA
jgi:carbon monoxide dehydrogenase subunit G